MPLSLPIFITIVNIYNFKYCVSQKEWVLGNQRLYLKMCPPYLRFYFWFNISTTLDSLQENLVNQSNNYEDVALKWTQIRLGTRKCIKEHLECPNESVNQWHPAKVLNSDCYLCPLSKLLLQNCLIDSKDFLTQTAKVKDILNQKYDCKYGVHIFRYSRWFISKKLSAIFTILFLIQYVLHLGQFV